MAASARAFSLSLFTGLSLNPHQPPLPTTPSSFVHNLIIRPLLPAFSVSRRRSSAGSVCCVVSGVDGGGVSDDFISTRKAGFGSEFSVIANMLKKIEPLDMSVISKGVSDSAKDSMKQTISTMLGLLPSDQFSVTVKVSKRPLDRLLMSSIITGYTLWNAEYRISLMRNFDIPTNDWKSWGFLGENEISDVQRGESEGGASDVDDDHCAEDLQSINLQSLGDLTPEALKYINQLESELSTAKKLVPYLGIRRKLAIQYLDERRRILELNARKHENMQLEYIRENNNDLLEYLRSLESEMVTELSRPSSIEVEEIIHQLVQNVLRKFFKDDSSLDFMGDSAAIRSTDLRNGDDECCNTIGTSRDYLAKLLFCLISPDEFYMPSTFRKAKLVMVTKRSSMRLISTTEGMKGGVHHERGEYYIAKYDQS
ncbi:hypothetical protein Acr_00g0015290 [Actinidia rufa]|uniref:Uncharacterized protein n=1 Tax=Actinidia rufa TaxID=165716 RepID=A0A7J0DAJ2_9ERIC|nr:hypothetical protein Acr_00g0015290 [Actinidia rufa]